MIGPGRGRKQACYTFPDGVCALDLEMIGPGRGRKPSINSLQSEHLFYLEMIGPGRGRKPIFIDFRYVCKIPI